MKKIISTLMSLALVLTAVTSSWATITEKSRDTYSYATNGMITQTVNYTTIDGVKSLASTTYYNSNGTRNYTKDANNNVTTKWNYNALTGNIESVSFTQKDEAGNTHVYTTYYVAPGVAITLDHGNGASLTATGVSGGSAFSFSSVLSDYNTVLAGGSWSTSILNSISSISIDGSILKKLSNSVLGKLFNMNLSDADATAIKNQASANPLSTFTFKFGTDHKVFEYSYWDDASDSVIVNTIVPVS